MLTDACERRKEDISILLYIVRSYPLAIVLGLYAV